MGAAEQNDESTGRPLPTPQQGVRLVQPVSSFPLQVSVADIFQAAVHRAIQDHELDKLFNPDFYDYQI